MLQKEFFQVQSFNPNPYWDPVIVNLSGAQKFEEERIFAPGKYKVIVQAAASEAVGAQQGSIVCYSGKIEKNIYINYPFKIIGYCGGKNGINLYSGEFKVNPVENQTVNVSHIFGTSGSSSAGAYSEIDGWLGSGNCLGNGWNRSYFGDYSVGAGSCLHILPVNGSFGTDYYFAFHATAAPCGASWGECGGGGSAYGGAASGGGAGRNSLDGGSTPYGSGGLGVTGSDVLIQVIGNSGNGIGHGKAPVGGASIFDMTCIGSAAFFNGSNWENIDTTSEPGEEGRIKVTYLGPLN